MELTTDIELHNTAGTTTANVVDLARQLITTAEHDRPKLLAQVPADCTASELAKRVRRTLRQGGGVTGIAGLLMATATRSAA